MSLPVNPRPEPEPDEDDDPGERPPVPKYVVVATVGGDGWEYYYLGDDLDEALASARQIRTALGMED
jgi:hypothetical protein